jgi:hypothetical protein
MAKITKYNEILGELNRFENYLKSADRSVDHVCKIALMKQLMRELKALFKEFNNVSGRTESWSYAWGKKQKIINIYGELVENLRKNFYETTSRLASSCTSLDKKYKDCIKNTKSLLKVEGYFSPMALVRHTLQEEEKLLNKYMNPKNKEMPPKSDENKKQTGWFSYLTPWGGWTSSQSDENKKKSNNLTENTNKDMTSRSKTQENKKVVSIKSIYPQLNALLKNIEDDPKNLRLYQVALMHQIIQDFIELTADSKISPEIEKKFYLDDKSTQRLISSLESCYKPVDQDKSTNDTQDKFALDTKYLECLKLVRKLLNQRQKEDDKKTTSNSQLIVDRSIFIARLIRHIEHIEYLAPKKTQSKTPKKNSNKLITSPEEKLTAQPPQLIAKGGSTQKNTHTNKHRLIGNTELNQSTTSEEEKNESKTDIIGTPTHLGEKYGGNSHSKIESTLQKFLKIRRSTSETSPPTTSEQKLPLDNGNKKQGRDKLVKVNKLNASIARQTIQRGMNDTLTTKKSNIDDKSQQTLNSKDKTNQQSTNSPPESTNNLDHSNNMPQSNQDIIKQGTKDSMKTPNLQANDKIEKKHNDKNVSFNTNTNQLKNKETVQKDSDKNIDQPLLNQINSNKPNYSKTQFGETSKISSTERNLKENVSLTTDNTNLNNTQSDSPLGDSINDINTPTNNNTLSSNSSNNSTDNDSGSDNNTVSSDITSPTVSTTPVTTIDTHSGGIIIIDDNTPTLEETDTPTPPTSKQNSLLNNDTKEQRGKAIHKLDDNTANEPTEQKIIDHPVKEDGEINSNNHSDQETQYNQTLDTNTATTNNGLTQKITLDKQDTKNNSNAFLQNDKGLNGSNNEHLKTNNDTHHNQNHLNHTDSTNRTKTTDRSNTTPSPLKIKEDNIDINTSTNKHNNIQVEKNQNLLPPNHHTTTPRNTKSEKEDLTQKNTHTKEKRLIDDTQSYHTQSYQSTTSEEKSDTTKLVSKSIATVSKSSSPSPEISKKKNQSQSSLLPSNIGNKNNNTVLPYESKSDSEIITQSKDNLLDESINDTHTLTKNNTLDNKSQEHDVHNFPINSTNNDSDNNTDSNNITPSTVNTASVTKIDTNTNSKVIDDNTLTLEETDAPNPLTSKHFNNDKNKQRENRSVDDVKPKKKPMQQHVAHFTTNILILAAYPNNATNSNTPSQQLNDNNTNQNNTQKIQHSKKSKQFRQKQIKKGSILLFILGVITLGGTELGYNGSEPYHFFHSNNKPLYLILEGSATGCIVLSIMLFFGSIIYYHLSKNNDDAKKATNGSNEEKSNNQKPSQNPC